MLLDARQIADGDVLEADVALIGAGAAGITMARELASFGHDVLLLESGGFDPEGPTFDLYRGEMDATLELFQERYLFTSRQRFFGGTTNHWGGMCRPLDPIDFEARSWIPDSGWPFDRESLESFYRRACEVLQIAPMDAPPPGEPNLFSDPEGELTTRWFHQSPPTRFGQQYRQELVDSEQVQLVLQANVLRIALGEAGTAVTGLDVGTLSGRRFRARAKQYVLATGGIENARLLLLSNDVQKNGLGNDHDVVGRSFADHPHVRAGNLFFTDPVHAELYEWHPSEAFGHSVMPTWVLSEQVQRREQLLNQMVELNPRWVKRGVLFDAATEFDIGPWDPNAKRPPWRWASFLTTL
jgi:choline dehydrogenase-like flavoprotein